MTGEFPTSAFAVAAGLKRNILYIIWERPSCQFFVLEVLRQRDKSIRQEIVRYTILQLV